MGSGSVAAEQRGGDRGEALAAAGQPEPVAWWSRRPTPARRPPRPAPPAASSRRGPMRGLVADHLDRDVADRPAGVGQPAHDLGEQGRARTPRPTAGRTCRTPRRGRPARPRTAARRTSRAPRRRRRSDRSSRRRPARAARPASTAGRPRSGARRPRCRCGLIAPQPPRRPARSQRRGDLERLVGTVDDHDDVPAERLDQRRVVGGVVARARLVRRDQDRRAGNPAASAPPAASTGRSSRPRAPVASTALDRVGDRASRDDRVGAARRARRAPGRSPRPGRTDGPTSCTSTTSTSAASAASRARDRHLPGRRRRRPPTRRRPARLRGPLDTSPEAPRRPRHARRVARRRRGSACSSSVRRDLAERLGTGRRRAGCRIPRQREWRRRSAGSYAAIGRSGETFSVLRRQPRRAPRRARARPCPRSCPRRARAR